MQNDRVLASVCCITYNHAKYIRQALDSMLNQQLDGKYEVLVHDDASTDGTTDIVREYVKKYPGRVRAIFQKENQYSRGRHDLSLLMGELFPRAQGEYIAVCEGDDFWSDNEKLQKQIDCLKKEVQCVACTCRTQVVRKDGIPLDQKLPSFNMDTGVIHSEDYIRRVFHENRHLFHLSGLVFRTCEVIPVFGAQPEFMLQSEAGDRALFLYLATRGDIVFLNECLSCYRVMSEGSWSQKVASSPEKAYLNNLSLIAMAEKFDQYTKGRYTEEIEEYKTFYRFYIAMYELDGREMKKDCYRRFYETLSVKQKIYFTLGSYFPWGGRLYRKIKKRVTERN